MTLSRSVYTLTQTAHAFVSEAADDTRSVFDQHIPKLIAAVLTALLLWVGTSLSNQSHQLERQTVQIEEMQRRIGEAGRDRYMGSDAERDFARIEDQIEELQRRVYDLEHPR